MDPATLSFLNVLYGVLKDRPDLFITFVLLGLWLAEKSERKTMTKSNIDLIAKMFAKNEETNRVLDQIKLLLEVLTKGRK